MFRFNYEPFEDDIIVVGGKGRGKTWRAKWILSKISNLPYIIYDYNWLFTGFGEIVHRVEELRRGQIVFQPIDKTLPTFIKFCNKIYFESQKGFQNPNYNGLNDIVVFYDELQQNFKNKNTVILEYDNIVQSARNYGVSGVHISLRAALIPNTTLSNANLCFAYQLQNEGDVEWLKGYIGEKAWLLVTKDKRKKLQEEKELTKHSCIFRNQLEPESQILNCYCAKCNLQRQAFPEVYFE